MTFKFFHLLLLVLMCGLCTGQAISQTQDLANFPNFVPPSPEASALFKFVETPVSLNDGMAQISIPVYTITVGELQIPITLMYHSRGIKVSEIASRVGLGWSLSAGGQISRQIRGLADDENGYFDEDFYDTFFESPTTRNQLYSSNLNQPVDFDPDLFYFSFPDHSGKFIFDHSGRNILIQDFDDLNVEMTRGNIDGKIEQFVITDARGNKYWFGHYGSETERDYETTWDFKLTYNSGIEPLNTNNSPAYSSWYLLKIKSFKGEEVIFKYEDETPKYYRKSYDVFEGSTDLFSYYSKVFSHQKQLSEIVFPGGVLKFKKESIPRDDLLDGYALDSIKLFDPSNNLVKAWDLSYQYQQNTLTNNVLHELNIFDPHAQKRLFLQSVTEIGEDGTPKPPFELTYNSVKLPNRFSTSQDNWGYFNAADNGSFLTFFSYGQYAVNRRVDSTKNSAGMLNRIKYPTGGYTDYIFEQNIGIKPPLMDQIATQGNNPLVSKSAHLYHIDHASYDSISKVFEKLFTVGENKVGQINTSVHFDTTVCSQGDYTPDCNFTVMVQKVGHTGFSALNYGNSMLYLSPGDYVLKVFVPSRINNVDYDPFEQGHGFIIGLNWEEEVPLVDENGQPLMLAGGKRIKAILNKNADGTITSRKEFDYSLPGGGNSGKIIGLPNFYALKVFNPQGNMLYQYGSLPGSPLTNVTGNEIGYSHVTQYEGTKNENTGKTEFVFTNPGNGGDYYNFPYTLPVDNQWLRGKPLSTKIYKRINLGYELVKTTENTYLYGNDCNFLNDPVKIAEYPFIITEGHQYEYISNSRVIFKVPLAIFTDGLNDDGQNYRIYYQTGGTADLHSSIQTDYFESPGGVKQVVNITNYFYNYDKHYQLSRGERVNSNGQTTISRQFYPDEVETISSLGYNDLLPEDLLTIRQMRATYNGNPADHRVAVPVQQEVEVKEAGGTVARSVNRTIFKDFGGMKLPARIETSKNGADLDSRISYHDYSPNGNPLEVSRTNGPSTVYLWGYNNQYPVAKIENTTYESVENLQSFGNNFDLGSGGLSTAQQSALRSLPNALVTTFKYMPLVGMVSVTDPNGNTINFEYDSFNRLETLRDIDDNLVKQFIYNFKND